MAGDQHAAHELELYMDNIEPYYKQKIAIFTNFVQRGAAQYMREFGGFNDKTSDVFDIFTRKLVAENYVKEFLSWYRDEWPAIKNKPRASRKK